jgi:hypothetical protein
LAGSHPGSRLFPPAPLTGDVGRDRGDAGRALLFFCTILMPFAVHKKIRRAEAHRTETLNATLDPDQEAAFTARLRELRWKNSAWLATADTMAVWNGLEIRNAGSGRSPVRKRSG